MGQWIIPRMGGCRKVTGEDGWISHHKTGPDEGNTVLSGRLWGEVTLQCLPSLLGLANNMSLLNPYLDLNCTSGG